MDFKSFTTEHFNGNAISAIQQLIKESCTDDYTYSGSKENVRHIVETMNQKALMIYVKGGIMCLSKNRKFYNNNAKIMRCCQQTGMESEDIAACEKNPFTGKALKYILTLIGIFLLFVIFLIVGIKLGFLTSDSSGRISAVFSISVISFLPFWTKKLSAYFSFNKAKKLIAKEEELKPHLVFDGLLENIQDIDNEELLLEEPLAKEIAVLTVGDVAQLAEAYYKNLRSMFLTMSAFSALFLLFTISVMHLPFILLMSVIFVSGLYLGLKNIVNLSKIKKLKFSLVPSECLSVSEKTDDENGGSLGNLIINMETYGTIKYNIRSGAHPITVSNHYQYLANNLKAGDKCYLLVPDNGGKICCIFPAKDFNISQGDFVHTENGYRPVEGVSLEYYVKRNIDQQFSSNELTEKEKQDIKDAEESIAKANLKILNQFIIMIVLCLTTVFGVVFETVSLISALGWLFAFIPATVVALRATYKTRKDFDKVTTKYTAYTKLNSLQGKTAGKTLIMLAIGILLFVIGFLLSSMHFFKG